MLGIFAKSLFDRRSAVNGNRKQLRSVLEGVFERLDAAEHLSEQEILQAGRHLTSVFESSKEHAAALTKLSDAFQADHASQRDGFESTVQQQTSATETLIKAVEHGLTDQEEIAQMGLAFTDEIAKIARTMETMMRSVFLLSINAQVEAVRLGEHGATTQILAQELQHHHNEVQTATKSVAQLARQLQELLPRIADGAEQLKTTTQEQSTQVVDANQEVKEGYQSVRNFVLSNVAESERSAIQLRDAVLQVLGHLQFQDRMEQILNSVRKEIKGLDEEFISVERPKPKRGAAAPTAMPAPPKKPVPAVVEGGYQEHSSDAAAEAGEMTFF